jgi:hypothetical protein
MNPHRPDANAPRPIDSLLASLRAVAEECSRPNWDGQGAVPVTPQAVAAATRFAAALPAGLVAPEVVPEARGDLGFEWHVNDQRWCVISFRSPEEISWAAKFDADAKADGQIPLRDPYVQMLLNTVRLVLQ